MLNFKTLSIAALAATTIGLSAPAYASISQGDTVTTRVDARDLQTNKGVTRVYEQLQKTAVQKCSFGNFVTISDRKTVETCAAELLDDFVTSIDHAELTRVHAASS